VLVATGSAVGGVEVGVYQDQPAKQLNPLMAKTGRPGVLSTYVTGNQLVDPATLQIARARKIRLLINWMPDAGSPRAKVTATVGLRGVVRRRYDRQLRALVAQVRTLRPAPILRPMPEMNTPWYAWSVPRKGNSAALYRQAWKRVWVITRRGSRGRVKLMWSPYHRQIPDTPANALSRYYPGNKLVDMVGTSGYNFGNRGGLAWTNPRALFADVYRETQALAPGKPFWIAETGSTALGGNKARWILDLRTLPSAFPNLRGLVWYDVRERNGDFRLRDRAATTKAFKGLIKQVR